MASLLFLDDETDYDPTAVEDEMFLSEVPQSIMLEALQEQFENPFDSNQMDYLQTYIRNYTCSLDKVVTDEEEDAMNQLVSRFISEICDYFQEFYNVGFPNLDEKSAMDQLDTLHLVYRYFITNCKRNFNTIVFTKITRNIKGLAEAYEKQDDIVTMTLPKNVPAYVQTVIGHLNEVVDQMLSDDFDSIDEFVQLSQCQNNDLEASSVYDMIQNEELTGNFIPSYLEKIDYQSRSNIISKMRKRLVKLYGSDISDDIDE